jgi:hypothetical protein
MTLSRLVMMLTKENVLDVVTQSISTTFHQVLNRVSMVDGQIIRNGVNAVWNVDQESKQERELALTLNLKDRAQVVLERALKQNRAKSKNVQLMGVSLNGQNSLHALGHVGEDHKKE